MTKRPTYKLKLKSCFSRIALRGLWPDSILAPCKNLWVPRSAKMPLIPRFLSGFDHSVIRPGSEAPTSFPSCLPVCLAEASGNPHLGQRIRVQKGGSIRPFLHGILVFYPQILIRTQKNRYHGLISANISQGSSDACRLLAVYHEEFRLVPSA